MEACNFQHGAAIKDKVTVRVVLVCVVGSADSDTSTVTTSPACEGDRDHEHPQDHQVPACERDNWDKQAQDHQAPLPASLSHGHGLVDKSRVTSAQHQHPSHDLSLHASHSPSNFVLEHCPPSSTIVGRGEGGFIPQTDLVKEGTSRVMARRYDEEEMSQGPKRTGMAANAAAAALRTDVASIDVASIDGAKVATSSVCEWSCHDLMFIVSSDSPRCSFNWSPGP
jgi:hypothetical protein